MSAFTGIDFGFGFHLLTEATQALEPLQSDGLCV